MSDGPALPWPASVVHTMGPTDEGGVQHPGRRVPGSGGSRSSDDLVDQFTAACLAVGGTVHHLPDVEEVATLVDTLAAEVTQAGDASRALLTWAADQLPLPGVLERLGARGLAMLAAEVGMVEGRPPRDDLARLDGAAVGITGAVALLADTGSLVVTSGAGRPRLASLLPPVHVALVTRQQLVPSLGAWLSERADVASALANLVVITGPSRTADIEMTLTRGVHGPRAVHVVFVG